MEDKVKRHVYAVLFSVLLLAVPVAGAAEDEKSEKKEQTQPAESQNWPVKLFQVKYANVYHLANLFRAFGAIVQPEGDLGVISVRAPKEVLTAIQESIQRLDVPQTPAKNINLDAYLLTASAQGPAGSVPPEMEPVVKQLKAVFNYQSFRLLGTASLRVRDGSSGMLSGALPSVSGRAGPTGYTFDMKSAVITPEGQERSIRIDALHLRLSNPDAQILSTVDIHEGQKVVVGKANIDNSDNALILVLTAKVVE